MSDVISRALSALETSLRSSLPQHVISTEFVDFTQRRADELERGVITLLLKEGDTSNPWETTLTLMLVAQITVPERSASQALLRAGELLMLRRLTAWINNPGPDSPRLASTGFRTSSQMEYPNGWVSVELKAGPLDLADGSDEEIYPPALRQPGEFRHWWLGIDLPPHAPASTHEAWLAEKLGTPPDLSTTLELPHANRPTETG